MHLTAEQRAELERWMRRGSTPWKQAQRAEMILLSVDGVARSECSASADDVPDPDALARAVCHCRG